MKRRFFFAFLVLASCHQQNKNQSFTGKQEDDSSVVLVATSQDLLIQVGKMHDSRAAHTATLLPNGQVLICGGFNDQGSLSSAELYDPLAKKFIATDNMSIARAGHTAFLLPDGNVLISGGFNGDYLASSEIFVVAEQKFVPAAYMTMPRSEHTATVLLNGNVLIAGGVGTEWTFLESAEVFDLSSGTYRPVGNMTIARESHTATLLKNGKVLITGGHKGRRQNIIIFDSAEIFDPSTSSFSSTGRMKKIRHKHDAVLMADGRVLITGGADERDGDGAYKDSEIYDPAKGVFLTTAGMQFTRYKHKGTSLLLNNNLVLIPGGSPQVELYNPETNSFKTIGTVGTNKLFSSSVFLQSGDALITGGYNNQMQFSDAAWIFKNGQN